MLAKRDKIVYIPYPVKGSNTNEYTFNMVRLLERKGTVLRELAAPMDLFQILRTKAVFLNWIEDQLDRKMKFQLWCYRIFGTKIIWVFHNKYPHDVEENSHVICNMKWLANHSSDIILHSQSSAKFIPNIKRNIRKARFVPHILYETQKNDKCMEELRNKYCIKETDFVFLMFGTIRKYKNFEAGIEAFIKLEIPNAKLLIAGKPLDAMYTKKLKKMCENNKNIILDLQYIPNNILDSMIGISDVVVLPYTNSSSMNSGVMIQAFSNGKTVISPDICMARDYLKYGFIYLYRKSLDKIMLKAYKKGKAYNKNMGEVARKYMLNHNNEDVVKEKVAMILNKQRFRAFYED